MIRAKDLRNFYELEDLMGKLEIVKRFNGSFEKLSNRQLYTRWLSAREKLKSNGFGNPSLCNNGKAAIPYLKSALEVSCLRLQLNKQRDEVVEKKVKEELEKLDDKTIYSCAKICEPEEAEKFRRIRSLYRKLKKFKQKFAFRGAREYRWDYESEKIKYNNSRRYLISRICNYVLHPKKSFGEYASCQNDDEIKIIRKNNRSRILRVKDGMLRIIRREPSLYKSVVECEENLTLQDIQQQNENEDFNLVKNVLVDAFGEKDLSKMENVADVAAALDLYLKHRS